MKIEKVEVIVNSPNRNFVTLRITTDEGITGLGGADQSQWQRLRR
jgi:mannonate dehydratase